MSAHDNAQPGRNVAPLVWAPIPIRTVVFAFVCVCVTCSRLASISWWILCQAHSVWHARESLLPHVPEMDEHSCECSMVPLGAIPPFQHSVHLSPFISISIRLEHGTHILLYDCCVSRSQLYTFLNITCVMSGSFACAIWLPDISVLNVTLMLTH